MRALTSTDGDLISHFDKIDEIEVEFNNTLLKHLHVNNHDIAADKRKTKNLVPLEHIFGFCKTF